MKRSFLAVGLFCAGTLACAADFTLTSTELKDGATASRRFEYNGFGCSGDNRSPPLAWNNAPAGTRSYAVTTFDPDAPGGGWWHWAVVNIPVGVAALPAGAGAEGGARLPRGASGAVNDFETAGWGGACPPAGDKPHRYVFTVHALRVEKLDVAGETTAAQAARLIDAASIGKASFTVRYGRPK